MSVQTIESKIKEIISYTTVAQEDDIPFANYQEFLKMEKEGRLRILSAYDGDMVFALGSRGEIIMHSMLVHTPLVITVATVVLTFVLSNYWLLLGIMLAPLGFVFSSPAVMKGFGSPLLLGLFFYFGYAWYHANWTGTILAGSYSFSNFLTSVAREQCRMIIHRSILESESIFVWLHGNRKIMVAEK